jgi:CBS domain-containing protein
MRKTTVGDVMTRNVITVGPATPFKDVVELIVGDGVSAAPVVDGHGTLLGVVSEADLLLRQEHQDDDSGAGPSIFAGRQVRDLWRKAAGRTAAEMMTSPPLTVRSEATLPSAARLLSRSGVRRLCVVDGTRLVGVLARRDLLRAFLRAGEDIQAEIDTDVFEGSLHANRNNVRATVEHGVVMLTGRLEYEDDVATAVRLIRAVPGVVEVKDRLDYVWNGASRHTGAPV